MEFGILYNSRDKVSSQFTIEENIKTLRLHNWQRQALKYFLKHKYILAEACTGSGKTFWAIQCMKEVIKLEPDIRILILCPKNVILESVWYTELATAGFNPRDIGVYYGKIKEPAKITITNMQSIKNLDTSPYDFIIYDECHNYGASKAFEYLKLMPKYKIGLSATLERLDKKHYDIMECFNYHIFKYSIKQALSDDVINFFEFYPISVQLDIHTREEYQEITEKINSIYQQFGGYIRVMKFADINTRNQLLGLMTNRKQIVNNYREKFSVLKEIILKNKDSKILVFNQFNDQTNKCYWELLDLNVSAEIIHSKVSSKDRHEILDNYKNDKFNVLLTSKVLDEGYNLPSIQIVILMSNDTGGQRQLIQRIGRSLRKKPDGSHAKIYLIYVKNTIEENDNNIGMLKDLCSNYREFNFDIGEKVEIND